MVLNNGQRIRLLGIAEVPEKKQEAIDFILDKTKKQKVFLKFDKNNNRYDEENNLLCYLYLQNKTCINLHLIKNSLADADHNREYRYKRKFFEELANKAIK